MNLFEAIVLGIVQGLTEFLPVSSSGHLVIFQYLFGLTHPELFFDISVHVGTLAAVCVVFFTEIKNILISLVRFPKRLSEYGSIKVLLKNDRDFRLAVLIILGSVPTAVIGLLFQQVVDILFSTLWMVGLMLLITGTTLWMTRNMSAHGRPVEGMRLRDALVVGVIQGLAILPGISRSGATISAALFLGIDRETAGRYSFLLSVPAICGALILSLVSDGHVNTIPVGLTLLGVVSAGLVGYLALRILLHLVQKGRIHRFAPYCWLLGSLVLIGSLI